MLYSKYIFLLLILFLGACSSPKPVDGSNETFAINAISIDYVSSKKLNMYDGEPHVIPLVVYQLNNINGFNSLKTSKKGIIELLRAKKFDQTVMGVHKFYIAPNSKKKLFLNRATRTKWVCFVTGYYDMQPSQSTLQAKIPEYSAWKFYKSKADQKHLTIKIYFDKSSIQQRKE